MSKKSAIVSGYGFAMQLGATMDEIRRAQGVTEEEFHILGTPEGRPHLERMIAGLKLPVEIMESKVYLRQLYLGEKIVLGPTEGMRTIAQAKDVFTGFLDSDFANWGLDVPDHPTEAMEIGVHEMVVDGNFKEIYVNLNRPLSQLCLTHDQIIGFCVKYKNKLCQNGYGTFFLFKRGKDFFVADVGVFSGDRLDARVNRFSSGSVWFAGYRRRFVFPQLKPLAASAS